MATVDLRSAVRARFAPDSRLVEAAVWVGLVAIAVAGRLWQPAHHVTPLAAVGLVAGVIFPDPRVAVGVPLVALAVSNLFLPSYGSFVMAAVVFAATAWPALLARIVPGIREGRTAASVAWAWLGGALAHSLVFFVSTNLAYWWITDDYAHTAAGLWECFAMALPFYRWMPVGDIAWSLAALSVLSLAASASLPRAAVLASNPAAAGGDRVGAGRGRRLD